MTDYRIKKDQLEDLLSQLEVLKDSFPSSTPVAVSGQESGFLRYFTSLKNPNLLLTINLDNLTSENPHLIIAIELAREALVNKAPYAEIEFSREELESAILFDGFFRSPNRILAHIAYAEFSPSSVDFAKFPEYIDQILKNKHFYSFFSKLYSIV